MNENVINTIETALYVKYKIGSEGLDWYTKKECSCSCKTVKHGNVLITPKNPVKTGKKAHGYDVRR